MTIETRWQRCNCMNHFCTSVQQKVLMMQQVQFRYFFWLGYHKPGFDDRFQALHHCYLLSEQGNDIKCRNSVKNQIRGKLF